MRLEIPSKFPQNSTRNVSTVALGTKHTIQIKCTDFVRYKYRTTCPVILLKHTYLYLYEYKEFHCMSTGTTGNRYNGRNGHHR
jgi:hypothetical protein